MSTPSSEERGLQGSSTRPVPAPRVSGFDRSRVLDVLFGKTRQLSGPSSKEVLEEFGITMVPSQFVRSAHQAALAARTFGFPVEIRCASASLRCWNSQASLSAVVGSMNQAREAFWRLTEQNEEHAIGAEVLPYWEGGLEASLSLWRTEDSTISVRVQTASHSEAVDSAAPLTVGWLQPLLGKIGIEDTSGFESEIDRMVAFMLEFSAEVRAIHVGRVHLFGAGDFFFSDAAITVSDYFEKLVESA